MMEPILSRWFADTPLSIGRMPSVRNTPGPNIGAGFVPDLLDVSLVAKGRAT